MWFRSFVLPMPSHERVWWHLWYHAKSWPQSSLSKLTSLQPQRSSLSSCDKPLFLTSGSLPMWSLQPRTISPSFTWLVTSNPSDVTLLEALPMPPICHWIYFEFILSQHPVHFSHRGSDTLHIMTTMCNRVVTGLLFVFVAPVWL